MDETYQLVRALRAASLPRNRHFDLHASPRARAARRIHRFLRGVERDLRRCTEIAVSPRSDGGIRLELAVPAVRFRRTVELDAHAHAVLLEDAETARHLRGDARSKHA